MLLHLQPVTGAGRDRYEDERDQTGQRADEPELAPRGGPYGAQHREQRTERDQHHDDVDEQDVCRNAVDRVQHGRLAVRV